ncbi:P-loop NTPase fold protein [Streptomyces sp. NPDC090088]|uniref:P-loop NTPase fold protein n=1 Tax=Streptomyces sp. NPDC090088 TaxID=3365944 RepID=UPI0038044DB8
MGRRAILIAGSRFGAGQEDFDGYAPLPFARERTEQLAHELDRFGFECSLLVDATSQETSHAVQQAIRDADSEDTLVVHVLSHSSIGRAGSLRVLTIEGTERDSASADEWIMAATDMESGPQVLFLLDLSYAGRTLRPSMLRGRIDRADPERVWVIGAADADEAAYNGRFTQATALALKAISEKANALDPNLRYVPFTYLVREIQRTLETVPDGLPQRVVATLIDPLSEPEFPFFPNPLHAPSPQTMADAGHTWCLGVLDTQGAPRLVVGGAASLRIFDLPSGIQRTAVRTESIFAVEPLPDDAGVVCAGESGTVEVRSGVDLSQQRLLWRHAAQVNDLAVEFVDGRGMVYSASDDGSVRGGDLHGETLFDVPKAHKGFANAVAFAPPFLISAGADGEVAAWNSATGDQEWRTSESAGPVHGLAVTQIDSLLVVVSGGEDGNLRVWDAVDGTLLRTVSVRSTPIRALSALPERPLVAVGGAGGTLDIWDVGTGKKSVTVTDRGPDIWSLASTMVNGRSVVFSGDTQGVRPWSLTAVAPRISVAPQTEPDAAFHAGYAADVAEGTDRLGISREVDTLCQLIMAREVRPPLSIGLFGDWGTGKSFFMAHMRQRIEEMVRRSLRADLEQVGSGLCSGVCEIQFNAWHYLDANLWAGLASAIFDRLAASGTDTRAALRDLPSVRGLRQELMDKRQSVEAQLDEATSDLARESPMDIRSLASADSLQQVQDAAAPPVLAQANKALTEAGISAAQVGEVKLRAMESAHSLRRLWLLLRRGTWPVRLALGSAIVVFVLVGPAVAFAMLGPTVATASSLLGGCVLAATISAPYLRRLNQALQVAEDVVSAVDRQRRIPKQARRDALQRRITRIEEETRSIDEQIRELEQETSIRAFALKRLDDDDYRRHEGLMALLRRDLEELSRRFTARATATGTATDLERIVLYIDDLDRCPPHRVVEVLQAIQLLLAFPLFVVVVGVDARWLLRSVHAHYRDVLGSDSVSVTGEDPQHWASTPQNYLEKIFQISLCLPPMSPDGYARLVGADLGEPLLPVPEEDGSVATEQPVTGSPMEPRVSPPAQPPPPLPSPAAAVPATPAVVARELHRYQDAGPVLALALPDDRPLVMSVDASAVLTHRGVRSNGAPQLTRKIAHGRLRTAAFTQEGHVLLTGGFDDAVALVADGHGTVVSRIGAPVPPSPAAPSVLFSEDGSEVAFTWHGTEGTAAGHVRDRVLRGVNELDTTVQEDGALLAWTGTWRLTQGDDGVRLRDSSGAVHDVASGPGPVSRAVTDPLGRRLALFGEETLLGLWATTGAPEAITPSRALPPVPGTARIALSAGGLIAVAEDTLIRVWDIASGAHRTRMTAAAPVTALAFSPGGRRLGAGAQDGTVQVWAIENPEPDVALRLQALRLTRAEHDMIMSVGPLISTPRTARRLVNTYRLLRSCLSEADIARVRSGGHKPLILLLAVLIGHPAQGAVVLEDLLLAASRPLPETFAELLRRREHPEEPAREVPPRDHPPTVWNRLAAITEQVLTETETSNSTPEYEPWAPYVARFSFRTEHLL